jgi:hypothetical protein
MKIKLASLIVCLFVVMVTSPLLADEFIISTPFAFQERFPDGLQQIGFSEGNFLQVGCFIKPAGAPVKEITVKNLDTGLVLKASPVNPGKIFSGLYQVFPMPVFDPSLHMGVWEIRVKDQAGNETTAKTHKLDIKGKMPFVEGVKASGDSLSPAITWNAPGENDMPQGAKIRYQVRLLKAGNQFYRSSGTTLTAHAIPEGVIKAEDLSKIYVRVQCQGWDQNDHEHFLPLELQSSTILPLKKIMEKQ